MKMATTFQEQLTHSLGNKTKLFTDFKKTFVRPLIQIAVKALEEEHIEEGILDRISNKYNVSTETIDECYAAVYTILKLNLCTNSVKPEEFKQCLTELKMPSDCIQDLAAVVTGQKWVDLRSNALKITRFYPQVMSCRWRIDITISSSVSSKVLEPCIIMEWIFKTGEHQIFELSLAKFHQLRHALASILINVQALQQNTMLKNIEYR